MGGIRNILSPFVTNLIQSASTSLLLLRLNWKGIIWLLWVVSPYFVFGQINWSLPKNIRYQAELSYQFVQKKLQAQIAKGMTVEKIANGYSLEEVKLIAKKYGFEIEDTDTAESLIQAIIEDSESHKEEE